MNRVESIQLPSSYRLAVISDIHGNLPLLKKLLAKIQDRKPERLFLLGDFIEKGKQGLKTLQYIYRISQRGDVYSIRGNNDGVLGYLLNPPSQENAMEYIRRKPYNILSQMAEALGFSSVNLENYSEITRQAKLAYQEEINWLLNLPLALETKDFIFTHAGLENRTDWQNSREDSFLRCPWFQNQHNPTGKWIVAGHFPVYNYSQSGLSCVPLIDRKKKIISIDGGNETIVGGQLNALIIDSPEDFSFEWEDCYQKAEVIRSFTGNLSHFVLSNYEHPQIALLEQGKYFSKCRFLHSGQIGWCKNEAILQKNGQLVTYHSLSDFVPLHKGEVISVVNGTCEKYAKVRNGALKLGWAPKCCFRFL